MSKDAPAPPPAPDPYRTAAAQTGSNIGTAIANAAIGNANQITPYGSTTFDITGYTPWTDPTSGQTYQLPQYTSTQSLSPQQQQLQNQQFQLSSGLNDLGISQTNRLGSVLGSPVTLDGLPQRGQLPTSGPQFASLSQGPEYTQAGSGPQFGQQQTSFGNTAGNIQYNVGPTDFSRDRTKVEDAIYSRLEPKLNLDRSALETRLIGQGLTRGTDAFNEAMNEFNRQSTDARMQAILAGGQEQSRLANLALQQGQFNNAAQAQDFGQQAQRGQFANTAIQQNNATAQQGYQNAFGALQYNNDLASQQYQNDVNRTQYGNAMAQQAFGNQNQLAQMSDTQRERALQESLVPRNQAINEVSALMRGGQVTAPQFAQYNAPQVNGTDVMGAIYNSNAIQQQQWAQQMAQQNAMMGGIFGLGQMGLYGGLKYGLPMLSDRSVKRDVVDLGIRLMNGLKLYAYRYAWEAVRRVGLMADEVESVRPDAVVTVGGLKAVRYDLAMEA